MDILHLTLIVSLIFPTFIFLHGLYVSIKIRISDNINVGYISKISLQNTDAWRFANKLFGKVWTIIGLFLIILFSILHFVFEGSENMLIIIGVLENVFAIIIIWLALKYIEKIINKNFDEYGNKISK